MNNTIKNQVEHWETQDQDILSPLTQSEVAAIRTDDVSPDGNVTKIVLMPDSSTFMIDGNTCTCGNEYETPTTSEVTAWRRRLGRSCEHQKAVLQSVNVGGTCPNCGELKVERTNHTDQVGNTIMRSYNCANCGEPRREQ